MPTLELFTHNEFTIKDSFNFTKEITTYDSPLCMVGLDVESLFTNISLNEIIYSFVIDLHNKNPYDVKFSKRDLFKLLETETSESSFTFDYLLYKQVGRVTMGSPLIPILANPFLCHYENEWLDNCIIYFKSMIYKRYVEDIFVIFFI